MSNNKIEAGDWVKCSAGSLSLDKEYKVLYKIKHDLLLETEEDNGILCNEYSVKTAETNELAEIYKQLIHNNTHSRWVVVDICRLSKKYDGIIHAQGTKYPNIDRGGFRYL